MHPRSSRSSRRRKTGKKGATPSILRRKDPTYPSTEPVGTCAALRHTNPQQRKPTAKPTAAKHTLTRAHAKWRLGRVLILPRGSRGMLPSPRANANFHRLSTGPLRPGIRLHGQRNYGKLSAERWRDTVNGWCTTLQVYVSQFPEDPERIVRCRVIFGRT